MRSNRDPHVLTRYFPTRRSSALALTIAVADANHAPLFVPAGLQLVREGTNLVFRVVANDPDADPLQLSVVSGLPGGALFVANSGEFQWPPDHDQARSEERRVGRECVSTGRYRG